MFSMAEARRFVFNFETISTVKLQKVCDLLMELKLNKNLTQSEQWLFPLVKAELVKRGITSSYGVSIIEKE